MRARAKWLVLVLLLILFQGFVYQQFLVLTESGLRVIFQVANSVNLFGYV